MKAVTLTPASIRLDFMNSTNSNSPLFLFTISATGFDGYWDDNDLEESNDDREEDEDEWGYLEDL